MDKPIALTPHARVAPNAMAALSTAHWTFTTRRVDRGDVAGLSTGFAAARTGDLVLCEIAEINQHRRLQLTTRRYKTSYVGDLFVACVGDRYAPDQYQGRAEITAEGGDLLAGGGVVGTVECAHQRMAPPTRVRPVGLLLDAGGSVINVSRYGIKRQPVPSDVTVIGVFGASMNAGKTTAAVSLAHGLSRAGYDVAGAKVTGTGSFGDFVAFEDAGIATLDFTDAGLASTYRVPLARIEDGFETLVGHAAAGGAQIVVAEIADGVFQKETAAILRGSRIKDRLDGILFAAPDALGSMGGVTVLDGYGLRPFAVSGMVTRSPLAVSEALAATGVPHLTREQLCDPVSIADRVRPLLRGQQVERRVAA
ncbi:MAG: hypothetical protein NXH91_10950 [Phyllobacteriaceae bacterium]|nr:hypothetical protein [Phyllobacteriaceae bacterium]